VEAIDENSVNVHKKSRDVILELNEEIRIVYSR
jgi:hypothetical protein